MRARIMTLLFFGIFFLLLDYYFFQGILAASKNWSPLWKNITRYGFWVPTAFSFVALFWWAFDDPYKYSANFRTIVLTSLTAIYFSKLFGILFLFVDDLQRGVRWVVRLFQKSPDGKSVGEVITRSEFLAQAAMVAATIPLGAMAYGVISGAHDYSVKRITVKLPNLPKSFDGIKIGQVSDIHAGSFFNKTAVKGGVEMMMNEKPDVILFTGDLVNNESSEVKDYTEIFNKLKAPLGIFSVTGNHDYGNYKAWSSQEVKQKNFQDLLAAHKHMGYDILMNEHRMLEQGGEKIAIIGIENWGMGRFPKYGKMNEAYAGTEEAPVKLLLSHDPSHWDEEVRKLYPDIDLMFAGHTHGFQFGIEIGGFKWSPSQYAYKQWAGLYTQGKQHLYVNRGFGYLGYPGRIGMPPELTIIELKRA